MDRRVLKRFDPLALGSIDNLPIIPIEDDTQTLYGKSQGEYQVIRCSVKPGKSYRTTINFWNIGELSYRIGAEGAPWREIGAITNGFSGSELEMAVYLDPGIHSFACLNARYLTLSISSELDPIVRAVGLQEIRANPVLPRAVGAEFKATARFRVTTNVAIKVAIDGEVWENTNNSANYVHIPNAHGGGPVSGQGVNLDASPEIRITSFDPAQSELGFYLAPRV